MNVKRYFASTAREALRALKAELGADAIVLSNRAVDGGVEILALPAEAVGVIDNGASSRGEPASTTPLATAQTAVAAPRSMGADRSGSPGEDDYTVSLSSSRRRAAGADGGARGGPAPARGPSGHAPAGRAMHGEFDTIGDRYAFDAEHPRQTASQPAQQPRSARDLHDHIDPRTRDDGRASAQVIRPFAPPRMETPDYLMRKRDENPEGGPYGYDDDLQGRAPYDENAWSSRSTPRNDASGAPHGAPGSARGVRRDAGREARGHGDRDTRTAIEARVKIDDAVSYPTPSAEPEPDTRIRDLQQANAQLMEELSGIRGMIERQLAGFAWGEIRRNAPARAEIVGELLDAGFSAALSRQLADAVGEHVSIEEAREVVRNALARDLRAMSSDADLIDRGGVYALVGPTGVGKTTTTAKIAARCVVRHGAEKLALITTDGYRIGAQEQLRIYGRILGVPVFPVRDAADLRQTLGELRGKHMVLIDTVGMSQRDRMVAQQAAMLMGAGNVRRLLLLNATVRGDTLDDVIRAYRGPDLAGCVFTKVDEAATLAPVIGAAIMHELDVMYVTNGQRVPEDLHLPNRSYLMHRALRVQHGESPWHMKPDEAALMMAAAAGGA